MGGAWRAAGQFPVKGGKAATTAGHYRGDCEVNSILASGVPADLFRADDGESPPPFDHSLHFIDRFFHPQ